MCVYITVECIKTRQHTLGCILTLCVCVYICTCWSRFVYIHIHTSQSHLRRNVNLLRLGDAAVLLMGARYHMPYFVYRDGRGFSASCPYIRMPGKRTGLGCIYTMSGLDSRLMHVPGAVCYIYTLSLAPVVCAGQD